MPLFFRRRIVALGAPFNYSNWLTKHFPLADRWDHQDLSGSSVLEASYTTALALGRSVALVTYGDYVAGANWANSSGEIARHSAGSVETFQQDDILAAGKTYQATITLANRTAGSVTITDGGAAISANEQTTRTITSTGTDFIITPTTDFDGDIDVAVILVQQTGILASSAYPLPEEISNPGLPFTFTGDDPDSYTVFGESTPNREVSEVGSGQSQGGAGTGSINIFSDSATQVGFFESTLVVGIRYRAIVVISAITGTLRLTDGATNVQDWTTTGTKIIEYIALGGRGQLRNVNASNVTIDHFSIVPVNPMNGDTTVAQVGVPSNFGSLGLSVVDDGAASFSDFLSAEVNSKFNPNTGFVNIWVEVDGAGVWTDGVQRTVLRIEADNSNNLIDLRKDAANNSFSFLFRSGGTNKTITKTGFSPIDQYLATLVWDRTVSNEVEAFIDGVSIGSAATLGLWVGNLVAAIIGARTLFPASVWDGSRTRLMLGYEAITPAQVLSLYNQGRR